MNPFHAGQPVSARVLNAMKSAADVIRRLRPGRGMSIRQAGDGAIFECTLPFKPRLFARVTRVTTGSGSGSGSGGSGSGIAGKPPPADPGSGEEAPTEPPATPADPGGDVVAGSGSGASGSGEACPAGDKPVYAFVEVAPTCGGQWETRENGVTGDGNTLNPAYPMNDGSVADGTVVEIVPGALWWNGVRFVQEWVIVSVSSGTRRRIELVTNVCLVQGSGSGSGSGASGSPE